MRNRLYLAFLLIFFLFLTCRRDEFDVLIFAEVFTMVNSDEANNVVVLKAEVRSLANRTITERGFILSTSNPAPDLTSNDLILLPDSIIQDTIFEKTIEKNALPSTDSEYYVRAYLKYFDPVEKVEITVLGEEIKSFSFSLRITVNSPVSACTTTVLSGNILNLPPGEALGEHGFVYSPGKEFPVAGEDFTLALGAIPANAADPFPFSDTLSNLQFNTTYHVRAYVKNPKEEYAYSNTSSFSIDGEDGDGDGVINQCDNCPSKANSGQSDMDDDGFGDACDNCPGNPNPEQVDMDSDGLGDICDTDNDNDGVLDNVDRDSLNPFICEDKDNDGCDDCSIGVDGFGPEPDFNPHNDGPDDDGDGICDPVDTDGDGVPNGSDPFPDDPQKCGDTDNDSCDDCAGPDSLFNPATDGPDDDLDGLCNAGDNCDFISNPDQLDTDGDGQGDVCDEDMDNDGVLNGEDSEPLDPNLCGDIDNDGCDDCSVGTDDFGPLPDNDPFNDGPDPDGDGICNPPDTDNDGVPNGADPEPNNPDICGDSDNDGCDDCSIGTDDFGPLPDNDPFNDGDDTDGDGICDLGDGDDDNDGVSDQDDPAPLDPNICGDNDGDGCDDCFIGTDDFGPLPDNDPNNDGPDNDMDGICNSSDGCPNDALNDIDGDGRCADEDNCDFVANSGQEDFDMDGVGDVCDNCPDTLNVNQTDFDQDGFGDVCDNCPSVYNPGQKDCDGDGIGAACDPDDDGNCLQSPNVKKKQIDR